ncbi:MAG TPA: NAD-dependent epimerase/dehydratase family protein [Candidatus Sulfotelmatobacter sp.]|nr:NAD-dependent epimerase/dehydratase family protein [Candidatus Sulfotelmatobacter sp.]
MPEVSLLTHLEGARVLITGGLGFLGSNLAIRLVELGARVSLLDAMLDQHGGNLFNIASIQGDVTVNFSDIRDEGSLKYLVRGQDYIFHLAGQNDHVLSLQNPFPDIDINIKGAAMLLETCRRANPKVRLVYSGTRGEYGPAVMLPVGEDQPLHPRGIYELSSLTAQKLFQIYHDHHGVASVTLRLTNIYGERAQMRHSRFGVANWFIRLALDGATIPVFGDGTLLRDFLYVQDAVEAMLHCAVTEEAYGQVFNVGNSHAASFRELAETVVRVAGTGRWELVPFSPERAAQEPGDFVSDIRKIGRVVGWRPTTALEDGVRSTVEFYRQHKAHYW